MMRAGGLGGGSAMQITGTTGDAGAIRWSPSTGRIERNAVPNADSRVIVIDVGPIAGNGAVQPIFARHRNDGGVLAPLSSPETRSERC